MRPPLSAIEPCTAVGRDWNARRSRERRGAVDRRGGRGAAAWPGTCGGSGLRGCRRRLARLRRCRGALLLLLDLQLFLPRFLLRHADKILPADQHECREHDGEDGILIVVHHDSVLPLRLACTRRNAPSKSCVIAANGRLERCPPSDQYIVMSGVKPGCGREPHNLPQTTANAVSLDRIPDLL